MSTVMLFSLSIIIGIVLGASMLGWPLIAFGAIFVGLSSFLGLRRSWQVSLLAALLLLGGFMRTQYVAPLPLSPGQHQVTVRALGDSTRLDSGLQRGLVQGEVGGRRFRLQLYARVPWTENGLMRVRGELKRPLPPTNPGEFDFGNFLERQGIAGLFFADELVVTAQFRPGIISRLRNFVRENTERLEAAPRSLARALILGDRTAMPAREREQWRRAGVAHVLAVSGTHITIFAGAGYLLLRRFLGYQAAFFWAGWLAIFYALVVGENMSAWRAALTFALVAIGNIALRKPEPVQILAVVGAGMLVMAPEAALDAGFILSFAATAGLILLTPPLLTIFRGPRYLRMLLAGSMAAQLFTLPIIVNVFHAWPVYGLAANLVLVPFSAVLLYAAFLVSLLGRVPVIGFIAAQVFSLASFMASWLVGVVAALPFATLHLLAMPALFVALFYAALCLFIKYHREWPKMVLVCLLLLPLLLASIPTLVAWQDTTVTFLRMEDAEVVHLTLGGRHYLVGAASETAVRHNLVPYLRSQGVNKLEGVFSTEIEFEEEPGLAGVSREFVVRRFYSAQDLGQSNSWRQQFGPALLTMWRTSAAELDQDGHSIVVLLQERNFKALLALDLWPQVEELESSLPAVQVLYLPYATSSPAQTEAMLNLTTPQVIISRFSPQSSQTAERELLKKWRDHGSRVFFSEESGAVRIRLAREYYHVYLFREGGWHHERTYALPRAN